MTDVNIPTATATFALALTDKEIPLFRGALLHTDTSGSTLFHDHIGNGFRYSYPLIQYRVIEQKAAVFGVGDGVPAIQGLLQSGLPCPIRIGCRNEVLRLQSFDGQMSHLSLSGSHHTYIVHRYLPLNQDNYQIFLNCNSLIERYTLVEKCLTGNILSAAKSLGVFFGGKVEVRLQEVDAVRHYHYKGINMLGFDLSFTSNVILPDMIGLGKGVSLGFGIVRLQTK